MRFSFYFSVIFVSVILLSTESFLPGADGCYTLTENGKPVPYSCFTPEQTVQLPRVYRPQADELRGIWITTAWNLDFPVHQRAEDFRKDFSSCIANIKAAGFNAVFFQVRPMNDAFYPSKLNPWSRYLSGQEGAALDKNFDPLAYMIETTHNAGLEFHAWLNPYRISAGISTSVREYLTTLNRNNIAVRKPHLVLATPNKNGKRALMLNPGEPEVQLFLIDTIRELIQNYDLDGIHFDDYFYPYDDMGDSDSATCKKYATKNTSVENWRRSNIDRLVFSVHRLIQTNNRQQGKNTRFGISPFGIWANRTTERPTSPDALKKWLETPSSPLGSPTKGGQSLFQQYADTRKWVKNGWVDYIVPQLYWGFSNRHSGYASIVDWWADTVNGTDVRLYIGIGAAKSGVSYDMMREKELAEQLLYNTKRPNISGCVFFSYRSVFAPANDTMRKAVRMVIEYCWYGKYNTK